MFQLRRDSACWQPEMLALHEDHSARLLQFSTQVGVGRCIEPLRPSGAALLAGPGSASGCGDRSYAALILDLQERGAAGVVLGAPEGSDVFQLECRRALFLAVLTLRNWPTLSWLT